MSSHVLIIGGGIGGLCLAHGLKKHNISFQIFERDAAQDYRAQGYRIRVAREAVEALKYLFDDETWRLFELTCGETKLKPIPEIDATTGKVDLPNMEDFKAIVGKGPPKGSGPPSKPYTVDRTVFREVLLRGLESHMSWGKALEKYDITWSGVKASFKDGSSAEGSFIIGADGAHSIVRGQHLPDHPILDTTGRCIYGKTVITPELMDVLEPTITEGGFLAVKDRSRKQIITLVCEPVVFPNKAGMREEGFQPPQDYLYWVMSAQPEVLGLAKDGAPHLTSEETEKLAREVTKDWSDKVRPVVANQKSGETAILQIMSVPEDFGTWEPNERVTLIGDAVHLMVSPRYQRYSMIYEKYIY